MELWIRSQDKTTIIKCNELYIEEIDSFLIRERNSTHVLGAYETFDRALKILDEIQNILKPQLLVRRNDYNDKELLGALQKGVTQKLDMEFKELSTYVYEMPKEK